MTPQASPWRPTIHELLEDSAGKLLVVLGTCEQYGSDEQHAWTTYADSLRKAAPNVPCVELATQEQVAVEDVSLALLRDFIEKSSTENHRIFLVFSKSSTLPSLMKQFSPCYIHQVRFYPDTPTIFRPSGAALPQADSYEEINLDAYDPRDVDKFDVAANLRRLDEVVTTLYLAINAGDRTKLIHAYRDLSTFLSQEDFSLKPWQDSTYLPEMMDAWTKVKDARKAAWNAFGAENEVILQYLEIAKQCEQKLQQMRDSIDQVSIAKSNYYSPEADKEKARADWVYRHKTAVVVAENAESFAKNTSMRLEQEESPLGIRTVSTSVTDSWAKCLSDVTDEVTRLAVQQIQKVKTLVNDMKELQTVDQCMLKSL
jgi:hypothetical protein